MDPFVIDLPSNEDSDGQSPFLSMASIAKEHLKKYNINIYNDGEDSDSTNITLFIPKLRTDSDNPDENPPGSSGDYITCETSNAKQPADAKMDENLASRGEYIDFSMHFPIASTKTDLSQPGISLRHPVEVEESIVMRPPPNDYQHEFIFRPVEKNTTTSAKGHKAYMKPSQLYDDDFIDLSSALIKPDLTKPTILAEPDVEMLMPSDETKNTAYVKDKKSVAIHNEVGDQSVIDLSSALIRTRLASPYIPKPLSTPAELIIIPRPLDILKKRPVEKLPCLFTNPEFFKRDKKRRKHPSSLAKVMCAKFVEREIPVIPHKYFETYGNIVPFKFDTPSPDEVILERLKKKQLPPTFIERFNKL